MSDLFGNPDQPAQEPVSTPAPQEPTAPQAAPQPEPTPATSPFADQLSEIRAEDGRQKYADVPTALASIPHAQARITELTQQVSALQEELNKRKGLEEMVEQLQASQSAGSDLPSVAGLDETAVTQLVERALEQRTQQAAAMANRDRVVNGLLEKYGDKTKAEEMFNKRAAELGVSPEYLTQQALEHPDFVLAQFQVASKPAVQPISSSAVSTTAMSPQPQEIKSVMGNASYKSVVEQYRAIQQNILSKQ